MIEQAARLRRHEPQTLGAPARSPRAALLARIAAVIAMLAASECSAPTEPGPMDASVIPRGAEGGASSSSSSSCSGCECYRTAAACIAAGCSPSQTQITTQLVDGAVVDAGTELVCASP